MSSKAETYLRIENSFVKLSDFVGDLPDKRYVEGAIVCRIDGLDLLTFEHWDLVDQLWVYVVEGLREIVQGRCYETYFPDQPLQLRLEPLSGQSVLVTLGDSEFRVHLTRLVTTLTLGAIEFFCRMRELDVEGTSTWERYYEEASALLKTD